MADCQTVISTPPKIARLRAGNGGARKNRFSHGIGKSFCKPTGRHGLLSAGRGRGSCACGGGPRKRNSDSARHSGIRIFTNAAHQRDVKRPFGAGRRPASGRLFRKKAEIRIATTRQKKCFFTSSENFSRHKIAAFWLRDVKNEAPSQKYVSETTRIPLYLELFESSAGQENRPFSAKKTPTPAFWRQNENSREAA